jgi:hypothetical protein
VEVQADLLALAVVGFCGEFRIAVDVPADERPPLLQPLIFLDVTAQRRDGLLADAAVG